MARPLQGIELADLAFRPAFARLIEDGLRHTGFDQARTDRVDADARAGQDIGTRLHQADHARLAGAVGGRACARAQTGDRGRADDRAFALWPHDPYRMFDGQENTDQVDVQHLLPILRIEFEERLHGTDDSRIGVTDIQGAERRYGAIHRARNIGFRARIGTERDRIPAGGLDGGTRLLHRLRAIHGDDAGPFPRKQDGTGAPDPACRACDQSNLSRQPTHRQFLPFQSRPIQGRPIQGRHSDLCPAPCKR